MNGVLVVIVLKEVYNMDDVCLFLDCVLLFVFVKLKDVLSVYSYDMLRILNGIYFYFNSNIFDYRLGLKEKIYGSVDMIMVVEYGRGLIYSLVNGRKFNSLFLNGIYLSNLLLNGFVDYEI